MFEMQVQVNEGQSLMLVDLAGNTTIATWPQVDILIRSRDGQEADLVVEQAESGPVVSARRSCEVQVPDGLAVTVRQAQGNLKVRGAVNLNAEQVRGNLQLSQVGQVVLAEVYGNLKANDAESLRVVGTVYGDTSLDDLPVVDLQNVRGNLQARASGRLRASRVGGNLQVKSLEGTLDVDRVGGNAVLKNISGAVSLDQVAGNMTARHLTGGARVDRIGGNLLLNGELSTGRTYHFRADGNALLRLPEKPSAHLTLIARGQLLSRLKLADEMRDGNRLTGTLGDGGTEVVVEAGGNILVGDGEPASGVDLGEDLARQIEEALSTVDLEALGRQVGEEMEAAMSRLRVKLETVDWERMGLQTQQTLERAMERMQRDMDRMVSKATRHTEHLQRKADQEARRLERLERRWQPAAHRSQDVPVDAREPSPAEIGEPIEPDPHADEERLSILRMVEQGQITPEEAEMLLDALE